MKCFNRSLTPTSTNLLAALFALLCMATSLSVTATPANPSPAQARKSSTKAVVDKLVAGDFEGVRADFNDEMKQGLSAEKMKEVWTAAIQYHGKFQSQGEAANTQQQGYDVYTIRCEMERSPMEVVVAYDQNGKIGGLWVRPAAA